MRILLFFLANSFFVSAQKIPTPVGYTLVDSVSGDLDNDHYRELVAVYNTQKTDDMGGFWRALIIYKWKSGRWMTWKKSGNAVYGSLDGGMSGDPLESIKIFNGILSVTHTGGSSWKWEQTDKYRYQDGEFYLIGYSGISGKACENWTRVDFNLSTGKIFFEKTFENCGDSAQGIQKPEREIFFKRGLKITLQNRNAKEIKIVTPRYKREIFIAIAKK